MKSIITSILQAAIVFLGIGVFVFMLWEPQLEGRNAHATLFDTYFRDPFLACAYAASVLFFVILYHAYRVLGSIKRNDLFSSGSMRAVQTIRNCALVLAVLIAGAEVYLFVVVRGTDDIAGGVMMGLLLFVLFTAVAISAIVLLKHLRRH